MFTSVGLLAGWSTGVRFGRDTDSFTGILHLGSRNVHLFDLASHRERFQVDQGDVYVSQFALYNRQQVGWDVVVPGKYAEGGIELFENPLFLLGDVTSGPRYSKL